MSEHMIMRRFKPQPQIGNMPERIEALREWIACAAELMTNVTGVSREQSLALTHLEEALMWGTKAIVLGDAVIEPK